MEDADRIAIEPNDNAYVSFNQECMHLLTCILRLAQIQELAHEAQEDRYREAVATAEAEYTRAKQVGISLVAKLEAKAAAAQTKVARDILV